ncbi:CPBP family intramembrane metalloprotease [Sphingomonas changnyeongensis]|uniref:CPBP family intramembrane metalloprotease n=1 Tax=Sphingomonas changnyeongensis TaxID=2698679 RepID=A0A7Z2NTN0_9SPHN|nr:CPBP family intramembrane glutamic endopeptidase [Sphingomonas changnyeongensis]QHL89630.1 CPBP family intramembrane metalloprotease [Sphingomonas changnyeongensis]
MLSLVLLAVSIGLLIKCAVDDRREYLLFKTLAGTADRQQIYRLWLFKGLVLFGLFGVAQLAMLGRLPALFVLPAEFAPIAAMIRARIGALDLSADHLIGSGISFGTGVAITMIVAIRTGKSIGAGDFDALRPRNRAELGWGALLSLNAGIGEELFFRLVLPLLFTDLAGDPLLGFALATIAFGLAHAYQGVVGVLTTGLIGAFLAFVYLATGNLFIVVAIHAAIDLNALVLQPWLMLRFGRPRKVA